MNHPPEDPAVRSARREACIALAVFAGALVYVEGVSHFIAGGQPGSDVELWWGVPRWTVLGVIAPWLVCVAFGFFFAYGVMKHTELGEEQQDAAEREAEDLAADPEASARD